MGRIQILPDVLANKIAAGEVVERPASVAKELLENALDAGASSIGVEATQGGRQSILVRDDGLGMDRQDAELAFRHHATSKIRAFEDLTRILTLGFRGEALPSIASVARLRMRTVEHGAGAGTEIRIDGGEVKKIGQAAWPKGTEVSVEDLFFNVPVRRKFLKSAATELTHLSRQVMHYAMAHPQVEFTFGHQGRRILEAPAVTSLEERVYQVLGQSFLEKLVPVHYQKEDITVSGFTSLPHEQRANSASQYMYVNQRMVRDKVLMHAIRLAYQDLIPPRTYPVLILFLKLDPQRVDVNVHPSKTEIRFCNSHAVHSAVYHGLEEALLKHKTSVASIAYDLPADGLQTPAAVIREGVTPSVASFLERQHGSAELFGTDHGWAAERSANHHARIHPSGSTAHQDDIPATDHISPVPVVLGQFVESFVVAADREGVMLIDQHVAHERILYDRALRALRSSDKCPTQRLLIPLIQELNVQQTAVLEELIEELNANGFEVEWFGPQTVAIKGLPSFAQDCAAESLVREIVEGFASTGREVQDQDALVRRLREKIAISSSCHAAIKVNTPLSEEKMQWLLDELFGCENPYTCPHGRPIVLRLGIEDVLRRFKRI